MAEGLEIGDIVRLKSGGPTEMAVLVINDDEAVCAFSTENGLERRRIKLSLLMKVKGKS